jgi:hypothetical protein
MERVRFSIGKKSLCSKRTITAIFNFTVDKKTGLPMMHPVVLKLTFSYLFFSKITRPCQY